MPIPPLNFWDRDTLWALLVLADGAPIVDASQQAISDLAELPPSIVSTSVRYLTAQGYITVEKPNHEHPTNRYQLHADLDGYAIPQLRVVRS